MLPITFANHAIKVGRAVFVLVALAGLNVTARAADQAGQFDHYMLALSWSPTYCQNRKRNPNDTQCGRRRARAFAFIVHGLWPQYTRGFPKFCRPHNRPLVPEDVIAGMMDIMPSRRLIVHQYRKHGTCTDLAPAAYFKLSRAVYERVTIPPPYVAPKDAQLRTVEDIVGDFIAFNGGLQADMIKIICRRGNTNQLREVRICFDKNNAFQKCPLIKRQHACRPKKVYIPAARSQ